MATQQKIGKCKNLMRSGREKARNANMRNTKVSRARARHLKNAERSCGKKFADDLRRYYAKINPAPKKAGKHRSTKEAE